MRNRRARQMNVADVNMTPMLDIVFILLIFFIVTSTFLKEEALGLEPSPMGGGEPSPAILITLSQEGLITVNNRLTDIGGVRANIERIKAESPKSALVIQASPRAKNGSLLLVRDAAYSAGFMTNVNVVIDKDS